MKPLYLKFVKNGVANRFEYDTHDLIEMNENLKLYPEIFYSVLMHELGHKEKMNTVNDLWHDMTAKSPGLFSFMRRHPSSLTQLLPVYYSRSHKQIIYDTSRIADVLIMGSIAYFVYWLLSLVGGLL
jgi:hypothetical protein